MIEHEPSSADSFSARPGRRVRIVRVPALTGLEALAYALILVMVCGPLALGAFGY